MTDRDVTTWRLVRPEASPDLPTCSTCEGLGQKWNYGWKACSVCEGEPERFAMERIADQQDGNWDEIMAAFLE